MAGEPGIDYPEVMSPVDVLAESRADALMSFVEQCSSAELLLTVGQDRSRRPVRLDRDERLELVWKARTELRSLPVQLVEVDTGGEPKWRVRPTGPARRGQRRAAVRAPLNFGVCLYVGEHTLKGRSADISEGGVRCILDKSPATDSSPRNAAPGPIDGDHVDDASLTPVQLHTARFEVGSVLAVTVSFNDRDWVSAEGEVVRRHPREDQREEISIRFIGLPEAMQDLIRRNVFKGLRDLRARGLL